MPPNASRVDAVDDLVAVIVLAFDADPFVRWLFPEPATYVATFTEITRLHGVSTAANGGAYATEDRRGAAFWYAPGVHPDGDALSAIFAGSGAAERAASVFGEVAAHEPNDPHWYLRQIGVDPAQQGSGYGDALLGAGLGLIDQQGETAYLEATSARSRALYERHGFTTLAEISVDGSPPLWPMCRAPA
jgi:ribosomal protein S18 acetylase RimI-like enzyme